MRTEWQFIRKIIIDTNLRSEFGAKGRKIMKPNIPIRFGVINIQKWL
jgi:hypothetical protein